LELVQTKVVPESLRTMGDIVQDSNGAQLLEIMAKVAKEDPELFKVIIDIGLDLLLFMTSDPLYESRALKYWRDKAWDPIQQEINKKFASLHPQTTEEYKAAFGEIQTVVRKAFESERRKSSK
jgi:hypothetical protein